MAFAIALPKKGSSPAPSATLPQRGSRAISTIGEKVQFNPSAVASNAAILADFSIIPKSQLADSASGIGKAVLYPWIISEPNNMGICSLDSRTAIS